MHHLREFDVNKLEHELRHATGLDGVTHWVVWDDDTRCWYRACDVRARMADDRHADHGGEFITCTRCLGRLKAFT